MATVEAGEGTTVGDPPGPDRPVAVEAWPHRPTLLRSTFRVAAHATVWTVLLTPALMEVADGWRPVRDDAMVSIGSYQVFSLRSPLVGPWSLASGTHHPFFDLGPLLFWLLAVPVRLDPEHGVLWGAAVVSAAALSVALEAAWSVGGWIAATVLALGVADLGWRTPVFANPAWNPYLGLSFLVAAVVLAWCVSSGRFGWWPVVVLFASVAAQAHLLYALPACVLALACPVIAVALGKRPRRWRWLPVGLGIGVLCWLPPLVQEAVGSPRNLSLVVGSRSAHPPVGLAFGLHALATASAPDPVWLTQFPLALSLDGGMPRYFSGHALTWAIVALASLALVAGVAGRHGRPQLAALAATALVVAIGVTAGFALFPRDELGPSGYLASVLWVVGILIWVTLLWAAAELATTVWRRRGRTSPPRWVPSRIPTVGWAAAVVVGLTLVTIGALAAVLPEASAQVTNERLDVPLDAALARATEAHVAKGPVVVAVYPATFRYASSPFGAYAVDQWGTAMVLLGDGRGVALADRFNGTATNLTVPRGSHWPEAVLTVDPTMLRVSRVRVVRD